MPRKIIEWAKLLPHIEACIPDGKLMNICLKDEKELTYEDNMYLNEVKSKYKDINCMYLIYKMRENICYLFKCGIGSKNIFGYIYPVYEIISDENYYLKIFGNNRDSEECKNLLQLAEEMKVFMKRVF